MKLSEAHQKYVNKEIGAFIKGMRDNNIIIWDLETNGLLPTAADITRRKNIPDVLSISAIRARLNEDKTLSIIDTYDRYYYTDEYNPFATKVNHLYDDTVIKKMRGPNDFYPKKFLEDRKSFIKFCLGTENFVGHNIRGFDIHFLSDVMKFPNVFDTMYANKYTVPNSSSYANGSKLPIVAEYYEIETDAAKLHASSFDTEVSMKVLEKMFELSTIRMKRIAESVRESEEEVSF